MTTSLQNKLEDSVLRWGGISGIAGSLTLMIVFVIVGVFVGADPVELDAWVTRFPDIRLARVFENGLYLLSLIFWIPTYLALYPLLQRHAPAPALFGTALGIIGLVIMATGALPHIATIPLSDIYHASGATPADQASIALLWQATWGVFDAILIAGLIFVPLSFLCLGLGMLSDKTFGRGYGWLSIILGILGVLAICVSLVDPASPLAAIIVFGLIIFHIAMGRKLIGVAASQT